MTALRIVFQRPLDGSDDRIAFVNSASDIRPTVAVVAGTFPAISETFVIDHINGLLDRGYGVSILRREAGTQRAMHADYVVERHEPLTSTWIPSGGRWVRALNKLRCLASVPPHRAAPLLSGPQRADLLPLAAVLRRMSRRPELLHAHFGAQGEYLSTLRHHGLIDQPLIVSLHGFDVTRPAAGSAPGYTHLFKQASRIVVTSRFVSGLVERLGCPPEKIARIPIGINVERFEWRARQWRPEEELKLLSVARLVPQKGIDRGIRAVAALAATGVQVRYSIVGDGPERQELAAVAQACGIAERVHFLGALPRHEVLAHLKQHDVFLFPCTKVAAGDEEGQGIVLQEAQACGLPIVTTRHGGIPESVDEGRSALVVADDPQAVSEGLRALLADAARWPEMSAAGRSYVERHFRHGLHMSRLESLYAEVLGRQLDAVPALS